MNQKFLLIFFCLFTFAVRVFALGQVQYVEFNSAKDSFPIVEKGTAANLYVDTNDFAGVVRAAGDLQADINRVTGLSPVITHANKELGKNVIIIGTIGKSEIIDRLIRKRKLTSRKSAANGNRF